LAISEYALREAETIEAIITRDDTDRRTEGQKDKRPIS
jgi:hypothetical protein